MKYVLYVPVLKKNILSISSLDARGFQVAFIDDQVLMWPKGKTFDDAIITGEKEGSLFKLKGQPEQALVHEAIEPSKLWHRRLAHIHYKALPIVSKVVTSLPELQTKHEGVCKGCAQEKSLKKPFPRSDSKVKEILDIVHLDVCGPMSSNSLSED